MIKSGVIVQKEGKSKQLYSFIHSTPRFKVLYSVKNKTFNNIDNNIRSMSSKECGGKKKCNAFVQSFLGRVLLSACSNSSATSRRHWFLPVLLTAIWPHWSGSLCLITAPQFNPDWGWRRGFAAFPRVDIVPEIGKMIDWLTVEEAGSLPRFLSFPAGFKHLTVFFSLLAGLLSFVHFGCRRLICLKAASKLSAYHYGRLPKFVGKQLLCVCECVY